MNKYLTYIVAVIITNVIAYAVGYYIGYNIIEVKTTTPESSQQRQNISAEEPQQEAVLPKESLTKEKENQPIFNKSGENKSSTFHC